MANNNAVRLYYFLRDLRYRLFDWAWERFPADWPWLERMAGHGCAHSGCREIGRPCYLDGAPGGRDGEPYIYYCSAHIFKAGFCFECGEMWAGVPSFEQGPGWCENCAPEFEDYDEMSEIPGWADNYDDYEY